MSRWTCAAGRSGIDDELDSRRAGTAGLSTPTNVSIPQTTLDAAPRSPNTPNRRHRSQRQWSSCIKVAMHAGLFGDECAGCMVQGCLARVQAGIKRPSAGGIHCNTDAPLSRTALSKRRTVKSRR